MINKIKGGFWKIKNSSNGNNKPIVHFAERIYECHQLLYKEPLYFK